MTMFPNYPDTADIYTVGSSDFYAKQDATFDRTIQCIFERTDRFANTNANNVSGGDAALYAPGDVTDVKGKLVLYNTQWFRVTDEFRPKRNLFTTDIHHVELTLERVNAPETS